MKVVIAGGSGHLGRLLCDYFTKKHHEVVVLTRQPKVQRWREVYWDGETLGEWCEVLEQADGLINLAGRSVDCRYNRVNRKQIMESRVRSTRVLGQALQACQYPPHFWLQMSTATIYAHQVDGPAHTESGVIGGDEKQVPSSWRYSIDVAKAWEAEALAWRQDETRLVVMRTAMVMSTEPGGAFAKLQGLVRMGLGGRVSNGRQWMSWIHEEDFQRAVLWLCQSSISGVVNLAASQPICQRDFMRLLRRQMGVCLGIWSPAWLVKIGAMLMGTESELVLKSRKVTSEKLSAHSFEFLFPNWEKAVQDLCGPSPPALEPKPGTDWF